MRLRGEMSSWRLVLLVAIAACLRLGRVQADPLPLSLVNLVMNSPISSMKDLQRLLDDHSAEEDVVDDDDKGRSNATHRRLPRSLDFQVAEPAVCKVRTEVMEVTRSMLDRTNANFLLWPKCVEVQRCSGCCNSRVLQCVPTATETRHLQMTKIKFVNGQTVYEKVIIHVEDHLTCSCKSNTTGHAASPRATAAPPPRILIKPVAPRSHSKEELHRHDGLKHHQRFQLEDRETQTRHTISHAARAPVQTLSRTHAAPSQHTLAHTAYVTQGGFSTRRAASESTRMMSDATQHLSGEEHQTQHPEAKKVHEHPTRHSEKVPEHHSHQSGSEKVLEHHSHQSGSEKVSEHHSHRDTITATASVERSHLHHHHDKTTKLQPETSQSHTTNRHHSQSDVSVHHSGQLEAPVLSYSHVEVIGQSSGQYELSGQSEHRHHHHHHRHPTEATTESSTQRAVTDVARRVPPVSNTPPSPTAQRKRRRKQRRRMSKSAMRAMIMVMS